MTESVSWSTGSNRYQMETHTAATCLFRSPEPEYKQQHNVKDVSLLDNDIVNSLHLCCHSNTKARDTARQEVEDREPLLDFTLNSSENELQLDDFFSGFCAGEYEKEGKLCSKSLTSLISFYLCQLNISLNCRFSFWERKKDISQRWNTSQLFSTTVCIYTTLFSHYWHIKSFVWCWFSLFTVRTVPDLQCRGTEVSNPNTSCLYCHQVVELEVASNKENYSEPRKKKNLPICPKSFAARQIRPYLLIYIMSGILTWVCCNPRMCKFPY